MNRYEKERPNTGGVYAAVNGHNNRRVENGDERPMTFRYYGMLRHEMFRATFGIDGPTAWCGDRNNRLRRMIAHFRSLPAPRLP